MEFDKTTWTLKKTFRSMDWSIMLNSSICRICIVGDFLLKRGTLEHQSLILSETQERQPQVSDGMLYGRVDLQVA